MEHSGPDGEIAQRIASLRRCWCGLRLVPGGTDAVPAVVRGRVSRVLGLVLMVALRPGLRYRRADGGWHRLDADEVFLMRPGQWQERDVARRYDQFKLAFHRDEGEILRNRSGRKSGLRVPVPDVSRWRLLCELAEHGDGLQCHAALALLLAELQRALAQPASLPSSARRGFALLCDHLREHLAEEHSRESLAAVVGCHPAHVSRLFTIHAGVGYATWLERQRLALVEELLRGTDLPLAEIAQRSGFASANYLVRRFRAATGTTPGRFRESL